MAKTSSIIEEEAAHFGKMAQDWWDPDGENAMLHKLNPVRLAFVRDQVDQHLCGDECGYKPLIGRRALDVGCGAGLLTEPLARLGAQASGIDAAPELIEAARLHAAQMGLVIDYHAGDVADLDGTFDLVTAMEVIEHVADPAAFLGALVDRLSDDGLLVLSTPAKTGWSKFLTITLAETFGKIPRGTHDYDKFIAVDDMKQMLADAGLQVAEVKGISFSPSKGLHLSEDLKLNYLVSARRR